MFHHKDKIGFSLLPLVTGVMCGSSNLFLYCFYGKWATESYANMTYYVYEADWPSAPVALQKYFILMIANMQKPLYYHGFGIAVLNLETFAKVCTNTIYTFYFVISIIELKFFLQFMKTVATCFMMFKALTSK